MQKRKLERAISEVSAIGLGLHGRASAKPGPPSTEKEGISLIRAAVERGVTSSSIRRSLRSIHQRRSQGGSALAPSAIRW
jgi:hypothetical protein